MPAPYIRNQKKRKRPNPLKPERSIRNTALGLLARREHTRLELAGKLKAREFLTAEIEALLDDLQREGLQSDARFTESYVYSRTRRGFGPLRIRQELQARGVAESLVSTHMDFNDPQWRKLACQEYEKKFGDTMAGSVKERARRMRYLQNRGFTSDIIRQTLASFSRTETASGAGS
ncbi:MAG: regulatory protein RecX [Gammaproteobacteria bacterium]|nr:regulatory protein RecX [Gammaproteobacteria bacterium]